MYEGAKTFSVVFRFLCEIDPTITQTVMAGCSSGKRSYLSEAIAVEALIEAHVQFDYGKRSGPIAVYQCDECGQFHLTSTGAINKKLEQFLTDGTLQKLRTANKWSGKWK
jgi:hypothetical protein